MWKTILYRLFLREQYEQDDSDEHRLFEKTQILLYKATTLKQLQVATKLIRNYEELMRSRDCPLFMVEKHHELTKLWDIKFKIWKRG